MERQEKLKKLKRKNNRLRSRFFKIADLLMSDEREDLIDLLNQIVENEIQQEELCGE